MLSPDHLFALLGFILLGGLGLQGFSSGVQIIKEHLNEREEFFD